MEKKYNTIIMNYKFKVGENIIINNGDNKDIGFIFKHRSHQNKPTYLIHNLTNNNIVDQVDEDKLDKTDIKTVVDYFWDKIEYTGNNDVMSKYIVNNILKNISTTENVIWGPNNTNTTYSLKISSNPVWLKNKE